jgi:hypothetical protein
MSDIVERLRADGETVESLKAKGHWSSARILEQADEIARLTARVKELEAALERINVGDGWAALIARAALTQPAEERTA